MRKRKFREPVSAAALVPVILWLAAYFGFDMDATTASAIAGAVLVVLGGLARRAVTPEADPRDQKGRPLVPAGDAGPERATDFR